MKNNQNYDKILMEEYKKIIQTNDYILTKLYKKMGLENTLIIDEDVIKLTDKLEYLNTCMSLCEGAMKSINSRSFDIKNAIEWTKFTNGLV